MTSISLSEQVDSNILDLFNWPT